MPRYLDTGRMTDCFALLCFALHFFFFVSSWLLFFHFHQKLMKTTSGWFFDFLKCLHTKKLLAERVIERGYHRFCVLYIYIYMPLAIGCKPYVYFEIWDISFVFSNSRKLFTLNKLLCKRLTLDYFNFDYTETVIPIFSLPCTCLWESIHTLMLNFQDFMQKNVALSNHQMQTSSQLSIF